MQLCDLTLVDHVLFQKLAARQSSEALTNRELESARVLARGRSNKKIGATLFIGKTTVKSHQYFRQAQRPEAH